MHFLFVSVVIATKRCTDACLQAAYRAYKHPSSLSTSETDYHTLNFIPCTQISISQNPNTAEMPLSDKLKCKFSTNFQTAQTNQTAATVWSAVHEIEETMDIHYPKSFSTIEDAKTHIGAVCADNNFQYCLYANHNLRPNDPHQVVRIVKDKVCYLVAVRAHNQGEFYLDEPLPDRKSLRGEQNFQIETSSLFTDNPQTPLKQTSPVQSSSFLIGRLSSSMLMLLRNTSLVSAL